MYIFIFIYLLIYSYCTLAAPTQENISKKDDFDDHSSRHTLGQSRLMVNMQQIFKFYCKNMPHH